MLVIGDRPLVELVPLYRDPRSDMYVTQFDMKWVEQARACSTSWVLRT